MKKYTALILILLLLFSINPVFSVNSVFADAANGYAENFDNGTMGSVSIKNAEFYQTDFVGGIGAKDENDKSLMLKKIETTNSNGSSIYTEMSLSLYKKYFKFELNFMPASADFSHVMFATATHTQASPKIYCSDMGNGAEYALKRGEWNKIVFVCENPAAVDKTSQTYSANVDVYVNGKQICSGQTFKFKKNSAAATTVFLRFAMFGKNKTADGAAVYPEFTVYMDDVDLKRFDEYPEIQIAENEPELDITFEKATASANLKNAVMVLAGYFSDGSLGDVETKRGDGKANLELIGKYAFAKVFLFDSLDNLKPIAMCSKTKMPTVACWGDSLTEGDGSSDFRKGGTKSYPGVLKALTGYDVQNMGSAGETAMSIAARQGAVNVLLENDVTIPQDRTEIEIEFKGYNDDGTYAGTITPRNLKDWNPCVINGVEGTLSFKVDTTARPRVLLWAKFKRNTPGEAVYAPKGTQIFVPHNILVNENADISVIFTGTNGVWNADDKSGEEYADDLVNLIKKMLAKTKNPDKYIVIGLTTRSADDWKITDAKMKEAFGNHLVLPRERLATTEVLTDNGITPTEQDTADIEAGKVPTSLRLAADNVHFNDVGYSEIAKLVYAKMIELGYCE